MKALRRLSKRFGTEHAPVETNDDTEHHVRKVRSKSSLSTYSTQWIGDIDELEIMADHLYKSAVSMDWVADDGSHEAVMLRSAVTDDYTVRPERDVPTEALGHLATRVGAYAVLRMSSEIVCKVIDRIPPMHKSVKLEDGQFIEVLEQCNSIKKRNTRGGTTFCLERNTHTAIVWSVNPKNLLKECRKCEQYLASLLWRPVNSTTGSGALEASEKNEGIVVVVQEVDEDVERQSVEQKPVRLVWPTIVALTFVLIGMIFGLQLSGLMMAILLDGTYFQAVFLIYVPLAGFFSAFFISIIVVGVFQVVGPISQLHGNSRYYSGSRPDCKIPQLPHITIQCPVYKEDLWDVIDPTVETLREAIATYEAQGGTASILINDDGMQILPREDQEARQAYYSMNHIGWIARPGHSAEFVRAGAFKKASNMNYGLRVALAVEAAFQAKLQDEVETEEDAYEAALESVKEASEGEIWADGDIGLGQFILIVDADTRVPCDCLLDAAREFYDSPELAILQHPSGVLQVAHNFWENGLAHFTRNNYFGTRYVVSGGDATPFFGHNAFLRWTAIDDVSVLGEDGKRSWWSENHVSEDFEIALKLQSAGYTTRMAGYSKNKFEEGVCLTVYDEFDRWEKYAYGVSELIFTPVRYWFTRTPFTPLFRQFLASPMDLSAKCSSVFYMGTYFAIGVSWFLCTVNYFVIGWFPNTIRSYYTDSLQILIAITVIFGLKDAIVGPFVRYRLSEVTLFRGLVDSMKYFVITTFFFQGLSMHISRCLLLHLLGFKMSWGATNKSVEDSKLKDDIPMIWRKYKLIYCFVIFLALTVIVLAVVVPPSWRITSPKALIPMTWMLFWHFTVPLLMHNRSFLSEIYKQRTLD